jgi:hypothetical protein
MLVRARPAEPYARPRRPERSPARLPSSIRRTGSGRSEWRLSALAGLSADSSGRVRFAEAAPLIWTLGINGTHVTETERHDWFRAPALPSWVADR